MNRITTFSDSCNTLLSNYPILDEMNGGLGPLKWHGILATFVEVRDNVKAGALVVFNAIDRQHVLGPKKQRWPHGEDLCRVYIELNGVLSWHDVANNLDAHGAAIAAYREARDEAGRALRSVP